MNVCSRRPIFSRLYRELWVSGCRIEVERLKSTLKKLELQIFSTLNINYSLHIVILFFHLLLNIIIIYSKLILLIREIPWILYHQIFWNDVVFPFQINISNSMKIYRNVTYFQRLANHFSSWCVERTHGEFAFKVLNKLIDAVFTPMYTCRIARCNQIRVQSL